MIKASDILEQAIRCCGENSWQVSELCCLIVWAYETDNCLLIYRDGMWTMCFYGFCSLSEAKKIHKENSFISLIEILMKKKTYGEVIIPFLVCGKIDLLRNNIFKQLVKDMKIKHMLYYKTKTSKIYLQEV